MIEISNSGLVSLMGGKWTSFRKMGVDTVTMILAHDFKNPIAKFEPKFEETQTLKFRLIGSYAKV